MRVLCHGQWKKCTIQQLKGMLHHNGQHVTGTKRVLLARIVDGMHYGRLGHCPKCYFGRLKLDVHGCFKDYADDSSTGGSNVFCPGFYDHRVRRVVPCLASFHCNAAGAPRMGVFEIGNNQNENNM